MGDDLWEDDDFEFGGDFCAQLDKLVEEHQKNAKQAGPVQGSSQVLAKSPQPPNTVNPTNTVKPTSTTVVHHHLYGPLTRPANAPPARPYNNWQPPYQQSRAPVPRAPTSWHPPVANNNTFQASAHNVGAPQYGAGKTHGAVWDRPSNGVFGHTPSPGGPSWPGENLQGPQTARYQGPMYSGNSIRGAQNSSSLPNGQFAPQNQLNQAQAPAQQPVINHGSAHDGVLSNQSSAVNTGNLGRGSALSAAQTWPVQSGGLQNPALPWTVKPTEAQQAATQAPKSQGTRLRDLYGKKSSQANVSASQKAPSPVPAAPDPKGPPKPPEPIPNSTFSRPATNVLLQAQLEGLPEDEETPYKPGPAADLAQSTLLREKESAMEALRQQLEQAEREKLDLQRRLSRHTASTSMPAAFNPADLQRQLDGAHQQMVFKEQELMDARQRHIDVLEGLTRAEEEANRLKADFNRSEAQRVQLELDLKLAQRALPAEKEAVLTQSTRPKRKKVEDGDGESDLPIVSQPKETPNLPQAGSDSSPKQVETRSVGTNTAASTDQLAAQLDAWEVPLFPSTDSGSLLWRNIWLMCDSAASVLMTHHTPPASLDLGLDWGALQTLRLQLQNQVNLIATVGEDYCPQMLLTLARFLHWFGPSIIRLGKTGCQEVEVQNWLSQLSAVLYLLSALLRCCPACLELAVDQPTTTVSADESAGSRKESRVMLSSKGQVLRPMVRLKDRPPDANVVQEIRRIGGLMQILITNQNALNQQETLPLLGQIQQPLLLAFDALLSGTMSEPAALQLNQSGCLNQVISQEEKRDLPRLLSIAEKIMSQPTCEIFLKKSAQAPTQASQKNIRSVEIDILDAPLLCFQSNCSAEEDCCPGLVREALCVLVGLLEHLSWQPLKYLLSDHSDRSSGPPLSQRVILTADSLFRQAQGLDFKAQEAGSKASNHPLLLASLQECLLFLRCLFGESACALAVADDLISSNNSQRICLALTSHLAEWQVDEMEERELRENGRGSELAPWVMAMGSKYTGRPFYSKPNLGGADVQEIAYLAKSIRRRVLHQLEHAD